MSDGRRAVGSLRRAGAIVLTSAMVAGTLLLPNGGAVAAPPTLPPCPAEYTQNPQRSNWEVEKPDGTTLFLLDAMPCVGSRLGMWEAPVLPTRVELDKEMVWEWEASCGTGNPGPHGCLQSWDTELRLYKRGQNGNLVP